MLGKTVYFAGTAWPSARVTGSQPLMVKFVAPVGVTPPTSRLFFDLAVTGKPRPWSTTVVRGCWRTFVEAMDDGAQSAAFVQRYGDPAGKLDAGSGETNTSDWFGLRVELGPLALAWDPEDADGISRITRDRTRVDDAAAVLRHAAKDFAALMTVIPDPSGAPDLVLRANSLAAFLWLSAVSALKRRVAMRRCRTCGDWFELPRRDALYCSNACRVAHHREEMAALERYTQRLADPAGSRREQAEMDAALKRHARHIIDPAGYRRQQAEEKAALERLADRAGNRKTDIDKE